MKMNKTKLEQNLTGAQHSSANLKKMLNASHNFPPDIAGDCHRLEKIRNQMTKEADSIGAVPIPLSLKGQIKKSFSKLSGNRPEIFLDKLGERLAFERTGVRLYESAIAKAQGLKEPKKILKQLQHIHDEEVQHLSLLTVAIESVQADPTAMTPSADLTGMMGLGFMHVLSDPRTNMPQALEALLNAELMDNVGWELLIELARIQGQEKLAIKFEEALVQEQEHFQIIRSLLKNKLEIWSH